MKNKVIIFFLLTLSSISSAQKISQQVIGSSGNHVSSLGYSINYTVGETVITTSSNLGFVLGQGFHQYSLIASSVDDNHFFKDFVLFPNPVITEINIQRIGENVHEIFTINILDTKGRIVLSDTMKPEYPSASFNIENFESGFYIMKISDSKGKHANFKFIKI